MGINSKEIVRGRGHHKTPEQRLYDKLVEYTEKLKNMLSISVFAEKQGTAFQNRSRRYIYADENGLHGKRSAPARIQYSARDMR